MFHLNYLWDLLDHIEEQIRRKQKGTFCAFFALVGFGMFG